MTKNQKSGPVAGWTKQLISFGTSFAFFGIAGLLQTQAVSEQAAAAEQAAAVAAAQAAATQAAVAVAPEPLTKDMLGPVQPISETNPAPVEQMVVESAPAPAPAPAPAAAPAPAPAPVDGHTSAS
jgi:hypothetical protein